MEERRLAAPEGGDLVLLDHGGEGPDVLLVHHLGLSPMEWQNTIDVIGGRAHAVCFTLRGHGSSDAPVLAGLQGRRDLAKVVEDLGLDRPVLVLSGWLSSVLGLCAAVERPELFSHLVTINGTFPPTRAQIEEEIEVVRSPQMLTYFRDRFRMDTVVATREELEELVRAKVAHMRADWAIPENADVEAEAWSGVRRVEDGWHTSPKSDTIFRSYDIAADDELFPGRGLYARLQVPLTIIHCLDSWDFRSETLEYELERPTPPIRVRTIETGQFPTYSHPSVIAYSALEAAGVI